jgi:hypothetical protein
MTDHWGAEYPQVDITPNTAAAIIIHISRLHKEKIKEFERLNDEAAKAKKNAEVAFAEAFLRAESRPMDERRQIALLAAADARFDADVAERKVKACDKALWSLSDDQDSARTISATARDEMKSLGGQP